MRSARTLAIAAVVGLLCTACPSPTSTTKNTVKPPTTVTTTGQGTTAGTAVPNPAPTAATAASTTPTTAPTTSSAVTTAKASSTTAPTTVTPTIAPPPSTVPPTAPPTTTPPPTAPAVNPCAGIDFRNTTYNLPDWGIVTVVDGQGTRGTPSSADYVALQVRAILTSDFGGVDGKAETAVFTNANTGGTGQLSDVQIFTCSGKNMTRITSAGVGDRADDGIRAISMSGGKLFIDRFTDASGACCPGAAVRQGFRLVGTTLSAVGPGAKRKFMTLDGAPAAAEIPISFLPGTSGALLFGDTATARPGGLDATGGQTLTLVVEPSPPGLPNVVIDLVRGATVIGSASSGGSLSVALPATAHYQLKSRPATPGADTGFDAEVTIT
jgi:hypothetical protein